MIEIALAILLAIWLLWRGILPGWKSLNTDFPNYYVTARLIYEHYSLDRIYDWIWFQRMSDHLGVGHRVIGFLGLTPFSALPILPFSCFPVLEAKRFWILCNVGFLALSMLLLNRITGLKFHRVCMIALFAIIPLRTGFLLGQMHLLVLVLMIAAYVCHMRGWQLASGCCIALAAALKIYPIFFCLYFVMKRRWKALAATIVCSIVCLLLSSTIAGYNATHIYFLQQLPRSLQGESNSPFTPSVTSSSALFHRLFIFEPELNAHPWIRSSLLYAVLYPLWQAILAALVLSRLRTRFEADDREALEWGFFLSLLMFLSSNSASYQFVVLIAAAVPAVAVLLKRQKWKSSLVYLLLYAAACNVRTIESGSHALGPLTVLLYLKLWAGVALIIFYCWLLKANGDASQNKAVFPYLGLKAAVVVLGLWMIGSLNAWSHLKNIHIDPSSRLTPQDAANLRSSPAYSRSGLTYVAMLPAGYRALHNGVPLAGVDSSNIPAPDELSVAAGTSGQDAWVELASGDGSRLVHIVSGELDTASCEISGAQSPSLSSDESSLAFIREDRGHGSLWLMNLRDCRAGANAHPEQITPPGYDVRTAGADPHGGFFVGAVYQGKQSIFRARRGSPPELLVDDHSQMDSPAASPGGELLVVRKLIAERWQLVSINLLSGQQKQLTTGDCNAYTPAWKDSRTVIYATDCERGVGLTTLAALTVTP